MTTRTWIERAGGVGRPMAVRDLGVMGYGEALEVQRAVLERVVSARDGGEESDGSGAEEGAGILRGELEGEMGWELGGVMGGEGVVLLVEHDPPVITLSRRARSGSNLVATAAMLERAGVVLHETDRGGDITYHGPGQLVCYPILDLNVLGLGLHGYMRMLEQAVIETCGDFGVRATRDADATGVWVSRDSSDGVGGVGSGGGVGGKICAMGVRVRRWVTMHGLALNVSTDLSHFDLIVPCGLAGRSVTSLERELGAGRAPSMEDVKRALVRRLAEQVDSAILAREMGRGDRRSGF